MLVSQDIPIRLRANYVDPNIFVGSRLLICITILSTTRVKDTLSKGMDSKEKQYSQATVVPSHRREGGLNG